MAFLILQNSTTADASDVNANFYHVAQGSRLPMGGNSLESTDAAYDLGSSAASWNNLFCENIYINGSITTADKKLWVLEAEITLSISASSIEFTGLNGDDAKEYKLISNIITNTINAGYSMEIIFNGDSATNYGRQTLYGYDTIAAASRATTEDSLKFWRFLESNHKFFIMNINSNGNIKNCFCNEMAGVSATTVYILLERAYVWNNSNTLTSIKFYHNNGWSEFDSNTHIELWKRG